MCEEVWMEDSATQEGEVAIAGMDSVQPLARIGAAGAGGHQAKIVTAHESHSGARSLWRCCLWNPS